MDLGLFIAFVIAFLVISLNTILFVVLSFSLSVLNKCQAIASPSLSSSLANHTVFDFLTKSDKVLTTFFLSAETSYLGSKLPSTSIPKFFEGRSEI